MDLSFGVAYNRSEKDLKWGATFTLGDGRNILFWEDVWVGDIPLRLEFPNLYEYSYNKNCVVSECWIEGE